MENAPPNMSTAAFLADVFGSRLVRDGKVIRRATRDVERYMGREAFIEEVYRRGFRAVESAGQIVVFCNAEPVKILRPTRVALNRKTAVFLVGKLQFSRTEISRFPSPHLPITRNRIPSRALTVRNATGTGSAPPPVSKRNRRKSSASRSGPSIIANPAPGQTRAPAENGMKACR
jgi:hypothetical protein